MQTNSDIKTIQPYKLYGLIKSSFSNDKVMRLRIAMAILGVLIPPVISGQTKILIILPIVILPLYFIFGRGLIYDSSLKSHYEPTSSFSWVRDYAKDRTPVYLLKGVGLVFGLMGLIGGAVLIKDGDFKAGVLAATLSWGFGSFLILLMKKFPKFGIYGIGYKIREQLHENIDYNVKVDLNDIYGVKDKMTICYQNFHYNQKRLKNGDYMLGVSPQGIYFAFKNKKIEKLRIAFDEIESLGLVQIFGNKYVFHIRSKNLSEINIAIDEDEDFTICAVKLFNCFLNSLDAFILNGGVISEMSSRRRRVSITPTQTTSSSTIIENTKETGRSIELDSSSNMSETQETFARVVDIAFSNTVLAELAKASFIGSNRKIEL